MACLSSRAPHSRRQLEALRSKTHEPADKALRRPGCRRHRSCLRNRKSTRPGSRGSGAQVFGIDIQAGPCKGPRVSTALHCDLADVNVYDNLLAGIERECGRVDFLANVAGIDEPVAADRRGCGILPQDPGGELFRRGRRDALSSCREWQGAGLEACSTVPATACARRSPMSRLTLPRRALSQVHRRVSRSRSGRSV